MRSIRTAICLTVISILAVAYTASAATHHPGPYVPLCSRQIAFTASYLADLPNGGGSGFLFRIENRTNRSIKLAEPIPSSAHWYARVRNKWLWRASSGSGGSYVDAINERGPVFAYQPRSAVPNPRYITVPAHGRYEWTSGERTNPALAYRPRCERCNYPGERDYKAVFAYAYLPPPDQSAAGLLRCGLRTKLVDMPPKALSK
ncbi:MAG TPA: hypothetical protein VFW25_13185 [Silvibacterium sp.]|nr:hypothetical protein [Silvibacterium sp.]